MIKKLIEQYDAVNEAAGFDKNMKFYTVRVFQDFQNVQDYSGGGTIAGMESITVTWNHGHVQGEVIASRVDDDHVDASIDPLSDKPTRLTRI